MPTDRLGWGQATLRDQIFATFGKAQIEDEPGAYPYCRLKGP